MEQRYLLSLLDDPNREYAIGLKLPSFTRDVSSAMESYAETVQIVADSVVPSSFSSAEGAVLRCEQLTYGFAIPALLDALDAYFQRVVRDGIGSVLTGVRKASGLETPAAGGARQKLSMADGGEWEIFQLGLKILAVCANLDKRFADFETGVLRPALKNAANIMEIREDVDDDGVESDSEPTSPNVAKAVQALPARGAPKSPEDGSAAPQSALSILRRSPLNSNELRTLLLAPPTPLLKPPLEQLTRSAHRLVFDASFLPIQNEFSGFAGLAWNVSESSPVAGAGQRRYGMMEMPQFSLTPSAYITRIGEHLLTLPQQMELYQDDEGLCYRADLLPHLELARPAEVAGQEPGQEADGEEDELMSLPAAALYLTALSLGTQVLFVQSAVALSALSDKGARQLSADAGYLANVVSALDVEVLPTFRAIEDMCGCSSHEVAGKLEAALAQGCGKEEEDVRRRIASLRGVGQQSGR